MKVEIRFSIFLDEESGKKTKIEEEIKNSSNKQVVNLNFHSILSPILSDLKKQQKKQPLSLQSLLESHLTYPRYISFSNPSGSDTPPPHSTKSHSAQL